ncbi:MAG: hypothetical protein AVDCRST_MAG19-2855, partial [uncultured Thermomicrobiales bacterium]
GDPAPGGRESGAAAEGRARPCDRRRREDPRATRLPNDREQPRASVREKVSVGIEEPDRDGSVEGTAEPPWQARGSARRRPERDGTFDPGVCPPSAPRASPPEPNGM